MFKNCSKERKGILYQTAQLLVQSEELAMHRKWVEMKFILDTAEGSPFWSPEGVLASDANSNPGVEEGTVVSSVPIQHRALPES